jgi:hypothetical protein
MDGTAPRRSRPGISSIIALTLAGLQGICAIIVLGLVAVRFGRTSFSAAVSHPSFLPSLTPKLP